jgi:cyclase
MKRISDHTYAETDQPGCNPGFVVTGEGIVMIDSPQQPSYVAEWRDAMRGKGEVRYIINTEYHYDHIVGNFFFPGTTVIAHEKTRDAFASVSLEAVIDKIKVSDPEGLPLMKGFYIRKPSVTFSDELILYMGDHTIRLIHMVGHTAGQVAVYIPEERVVFTGDNIFYKVQTYLQEAYPDQWLQSLKRLEALDVDVIVPGHGEICDKHYIGEQVSFIEEWISTVKDAVKQGLSKEEARERISFIDRYPMDIGISMKRAIEVQKMNVDRLYDLLSGQ